MTTKTFVYTGAMQSWIVPIGVTSVTMALYGAGGGNQPGGGGTPGLGGYLKCTLATTPGETLKVGVGGKGLQGGTGGGQYDYPAGGYGYHAAGTTAPGNTGGGVGGSKYYYGGSGIPGYNGSSGGGGSAVGRGTGSTIMAIAGGGGASGYAGGGSGGNGGGTTGGVGSGANRGGGGTQSAGGAAGVGTESVSSSGLKPAYAGVYWATSYGSGGGGQSSTGGGGGGGYYGGGGGGCDGNAGTGATRAYGGGGGSSYYLPAATGVTNTRGGGTTGNGSVTFTYNLPPNAPIPQSPVGYTGINVANPTIFQWLNSFNEAGDSQTAMEIHYRVKGGTTWVSTGVITQAGVQYTIAASTFIGGNDYEWQVRATGQKSGTAGPWSATNYFTAVSPPVAPSVVSPAASEIITNTQYNVTWRPYVGQQSLQVTIYGDDGTGALDPTNVIYDTGLIGGDNGGSSSWPVVFPVGDYALHVAVKVIIGGVFSPASNVYATTSISSPQQPLVFATPMASLGAIQVGVTNPTSDASRPAAVSNDIYRSDAQNPEVRVKTGVAVNGTWLDRTVASRIVYTYRAVAVAASGAGKSS